jgi:hypothetical protein
MSRTMRMLITVVFAALMSLGMATVALAAHGEGPGSCAEQVVGKTGFDAVDHLAGCSPGGL